MTVHCAVSRRQCACTVTLWPRTHLRATTGDRLEPPLACPTACCAPTLFVCAPRAGYTVQHAGSSVRPMDRRPSLCCLKRLDCIYIIIVLGELSLLGESGCCVQWNLKPHPLHYMLLYLHVDLYRYAHNFPIIMHLCHAIFHGLFILSAG